MNSDTPFNPLPLPEGLLLAQETSNPPPPPPNPGTTAAHKKAPGRKRKARRRTQPAPEISEAAAQSRWQRIKGRVAARLCQMDPETLKRILTAAGVAAGVIIAILIAIKLTPIALVLLAILGLGFVLRIWGRFGPQLPPY
jgi:hypothetical protein